MAREAVGCVQRARARRVPLFLYYAPTLPHAPFSLPASLQASNITMTPAGLVDADPRWAAQRGSLLARLTARGHVCASHPGRCASPATPHIDPASPAPHIAVQPALGAPQSLADLAHCVEGPGQPAAHLARAPRLESVLSVSAPWLDPAWLLARENCEQRRLAHLFAAGLAWIDHGIGEILRHLHPRHSLVLLTSDHVRVRTPY